ncbi:kinase-like protein [Amniculicola lignicola CBS 123094]|uniref:Kinase-like protein n=1 Tax=Amniculicola lignicola CBS 123094 TaxID=1392246 RepID=A0A6A5W4X5_9PLEO|nr:kinase-like protein [Amniculicola lignicola CBS 123094]
MASHPNIVQTLGLLEEDGRWKLVMEHCEESLVGKLNKGMMSEDEVMGVWTVIVNATRRMHNLGLAHRDLKAQNVLFCDGVPKLGDFGSALRFRDERTGELIWADGVEGTEPYLAPEVWAGRYNASKADVWQLGVLLMAMWTRNLPWKTAKMADQKFNNFMENHEELFLDVPVVFHSVLRRTLTVYPEQRAGLEEIEKILVGLKA